MKSLIDIVCIMLKRSTIGFSRLGHRGESKQMSSPYVTHNNPGHQDVRSRVCGESGFCPHISFLSLHLPPNNT